MGRGHAGGAFHPLPAGRDLYRGLAEEAVQLEQGTAQAMRLALHRMQAAGVDAAGLLGRAGLHCPVRWSALEGQWAEKFPGLSIDLRVEAALETET